jgi:hypothetical protein
MGWKTWPKGSSRKPSNHESNKEIIVSQTDLSTAAMTTINMSG